MEKKENEERILLSRDNEAIDRMRGTVYYFIHNHLQPIADEMTKLEISVTRETLEKVITGDSYIDNIFKEKVKMDTKLMPAVAFVVEAKYLESLEPLKKLAKECRFEIENAKERHIGRDLFRPNLDFYLKNIEIDVNDGKIEQSKSYLDNLTETYSEYCDSQERKDIYRAAQNMMTSIEEFRLLIEKSVKPYRVFNAIGAAPVRKVVPVGYGDMYHDSIIEVGSEGEPILNKEVITRIK